MFPFECVLDSRVLVDGGVATNLPLFTLKCMDRKAEGYAEDKIEIYNKILKAMEIGVRLAVSPPAVSYLVILGAKLLADMVAVDKTVIVIRLHFKAGPLSYLIYDAFTLTLHMIPAPEDPSWVYSLTSSVSIARPCRGSDYALVHTGRHVRDRVDSLFLWKPFSSSPPWSDFKKAGLLHITGWNETNKRFSFNGHVYWVDLLLGVLCFSCDALFDDKSSRVAKFIPLPVESSSAGSGSSFSQQIAEPAAYRTMGIVSDSFIRFVSIDGFQDEYVELKKRTVTVWKLRGHDKGWEKEHELSLETLWGLKGFGDVPKNLMPMYPLLSTNDTDVVYLGLGEYTETKIVRASLPPEWEVFPHYPCFILAVDMRKKIVRTILPMDTEVCLPGLVSFSFSRYLRKALVEPCDGEGVSIPKKKKLRLE